MKISFLASPRPAAQLALVELTRRYGHSEAQDADYVVAIGGDGTTLQALQATLATSPKPVFSMRTPGSIGFLGNPLQTDNLIERLQSARTISVHPARADIERTDGTRGTLLGINEIVFFRQQLQTAKLRLTIAGIAGAMEVIGDGLLMATALGSTAYNRAIGGPRLSVMSGLLSLTGIAIRHPLPWPPLVINDAAVITLEVDEAIHHPVRAETSSASITDVQRARMCCDQNHTMLLVFDPESESPA